MTHAIKAHGIDEDRVFFSCLPNAGQPSLSGGRYQFMSTPQYCASYVEPYVRAGARILGGCCGTTPEHIRSMRKALDKYTASTAGALSIPSINRSKDSAQELARVEATDSVAIITSAKALPGAVSSEPKIEVDKLEQSRLPTLATRLMASKKAGPGADFFVSVELDPPKGAVYRKLLSAAEMLHAAGADAINVGDSPMARVRMSSMATCQLINQKVGIETIIHFTTRDRNLMGIQADLLGCQALGILNIIALTGDPPSLGNYVHATAVYDVDSIGLIKIISQLNCGRDIAGNSIGSPTNLSIACALNPCAVDRMLEIDRLRKKIEAGAHLIMTQPLYQMSDLTDFLDEYGDCPVPILAGIMPLNSYKHAEYLHNEVPGISIPDHIRKIMQKAGDHGAETGLSLAEELLEQLKSICQGTYLVPSFGRYDEMSELVKRLKGQLRRKTETQSAPKV